MKENKSNIKEICLDSLEKNLFVKIETKIINRFNQNKCYFGTISSVDDRGIILQSKSEDKSAFLEYETIKLIVQLGEYDKSRGNENGNSRKS